jgi:hypothetical protein
MADVNWNVSGANFNPSLQAQQTFDVTGTFSLPSGVLNPLGHTLEVTTTVTVLAYVPAPPVIEITTQPVSPGVIRVGDTVTLTVAASVTQGGTPLFQWYRATGQTGDNFVQINGATNPTLTVDTSEEGSNRYRVAVSAAGAVSVTSYDVSITVGFGPNVPTALADISAARRAMFAFLGLAAALVGFVLYDKRRDIRNV